MEKKRIAVLVSGGGTNLQALFDAQESKKIAGGEIVLVIASNSKAYAIERAKAHNVPAVVVSKKKYPNPEDFDSAMLAALKEYRVDLVVLAGYLSFVGDKVTKEYDHRMLNIHPSLIPSFCGKGFYGLKVHEAALAYGVKVTGATVHFVNGVYDGGQIVLQKAVEILPGDTPEVLQRRVMEEAEWKILPKAIDMIANGELEPEFRKESIE